VMAAMIAVEVVLKEGEGEGGEETCLPRFIKRKILFSRLKAGESKVEGAFKYWMKEKRGEREGGEV